MCAVVTVLAASRGAGFFLCSSRCKDPWLLLQLRQGHHQQLQHQPIERQREQ